MRFLVYEQASATGFFENPVTSSILSEGFGMLRTLTADLQAAGHSVTTILDRRFAALQTLLETEQVVIVSSSGSAKEALLDIAPSVDATYVIAPESRGILKNLMLDLERIDASSINSRASAIETVSNKTELYEHLCKSGLTVPKSRTLSLHSNIDDIIRVVSSEVGFPAVFKPETNAGCTGLSLVQSKEEVEGAVAKISAESRDRFLVQEMVSGVPASVSVFSTGSEASAASLNEQDVLLESPNFASGYKGGTIPLQSPLRQEACAAAEHAVECFRGLAGYVGVDFVLTGNTPVVIEVNPRLTTSYVGLRYVSGFNLAQAIIDAVFQRQLPTNTVLEGYASFSKVWTISPTSEALKATFEDREVVSPPFPIDGENSACAMLATHGKSRLEATSRLDCARNRLLNIVNSEGDKAW